MMIYPHAVGEWSTKIEKGGIQYSIDQQKVVQGGAPQL